MISRMEIKEIWVFIRDLLFFLFKVIYCIFVTKN